ncbi:hypothetical protein F2Q70_00008610 [Brassica cretica]|uniref:Uncharacterized protein n=1 Tax=Brassica cretica TaxID=69181 RepID=A0A3N6UB86_BRACR|nr:hypothetical protein F2Q70_00008610 [Brassica cretica]KAF3542869.1 hypothetical protein DY000_02002144 [Brassica cretica]
MQNTPLGNGDDGAIPISFDQAKPSWLLLLFGNLSLSSVSPSLADGFCFSNSV